MHSKFCSACWSYWFSAYNRLHIVSGMRDSFPFPYLHNSPVPSALPVMHYWVFGFPLSFWVSTEVFFDVRLHFSRFWFRCSYHISDSIWQAEVRWFTWVQEFNDEMGIDPTSGVGDRLRRISLWNVNAVRSVRWFCVREGWGVRCCICLEKEGAHCRCLITCILL